MGYEDYPFHVTECSLWIWCILTQMLCPSRLWSQPIPEPCPSHWTNWIQLFLSEWVLHSSVQRGFVCFFSVGYCSLRVRNYRLPFSGPEKGASVQGLLCAVYTIESGDSLHSSTLWVHSHSGKRWKRLGQGRNKHSVNTKLSLSWQMPS